MDESGPSPAVPTRETPAGEERPARARRGGALASAVEADVQSLLAGAVERLARETGAQRAAAWRRGADGRPAVWAEWSAEGAAPALRAPEEETFAALAELEEAADLRALRGAGASGPPEPLARVPATHGLVAAAPVRSGGAEAEAVLLLGAPAKESRAGPRPRTLAVLAASARRLAAPLASAAAAERLSRLDAHVRRLDRLAALGSLVGEIVHEIRNPLVSVKTFLQLLPEQEDERELRDFLSVASDELRRVERLLDVVLQHGRPARPARGDAACAPAPALESVARLVSHRAASRGVEVELDAEPEPPLPDARVAADELRQVLLNLVLNALDATPQGGRVRLVGRAADSGAAVELRVEDEGRGVPPALRERLFDPSFSTKGERPGGLGLAISRRIVEEAGGAIEVRERPGGGTAFRLRLPAAPGSGSEEGPSPERTVV